MQPFHSRTALGAVFLAIGVATALPALAASPITSDKSLTGAILAAPNDIDPPDLIVTDSSSTAISNRYPDAPVRPLASYFGDTANGRLGANVNAANGNFVVSQANYIETVTNTSDHAVDVYFNFYLKAGQVQLVNTSNDANTFWNGTAALYGDIVWDTPDNFGSAASIWSVTAIVVGDSDGFSNGTDTSQAPGFTFDATATGYTYGDYAYKLALGSLGAGETKQLGYFLDAEGFYDEFTCGCVLERSALSAVIEGPTGGYSAVGAFDPLGVKTDPGVQYLAVSAAVPEPSTWVMLGAGLVVAAGAARRGRRAA